MLEDAGGIRRVVLACGFVDLRKGIDGLATIAVPLLRETTGPVQRAAVDGHGFRLALQAV